MEQPQPCTKCNTMPEDILMLACSHDLCLNCAAERLGFQMKKRKPANSIVCEFCYERTPLDAESISQLQKLIPAQRPVGRSYLEKTAAGPSNLSSKVGKPVQQPQYRQKPSSTFLKSPIQSQLGPRDYSLGSSNITPALNISSKKTCNQHVDQDILYFCFTCKVQCICPQCVIHGKHKDHDVKTIKKSHPIVKSQLQTSLDRIESNIQGLLIKKNEVEKNIRVLNEQNSQSKRQIQQAFEELRQKIDMQEREILSRCDSQLNEAMVQLQKSTRTILKRIDQLKSYSTATLEFIKKDEQTMLNFYAKKWKDISEECKDTTVSIATVSLPNNEKILGGILDLVDSVEKVGSTSGGTNGGKRL